MNEISLLTSAAGGLCAVLIALIGWIGARLISQMDALVKATNDNHIIINEKINDNHNEVHTRINGIDKRLVKVETTLEKE